MYRSRYRRILWFSGRMMLSVLCWDFFLPRIGLKRISAKNRTKRWQNHAARFRKLAISMGGVMIKVGQFLSTRIDLFPKAIIDELSGLQDEVPPVPNDQIRLVIETEFGTSIDNQFIDFNPIPLAAASLGQVHRAKIIAQPPHPQIEKSGNGHLPKPTLVNVVVKVQRPDIEKLIAVDLEALRTVGGWLSHFKAIRRRADIPALLDEFSKILYEEIDYLAEGRNAEKFASNFGHNPGVRVPKVYWEHTTVRVLTLEDVFAIKITDYQAITEANIDRAEVAARLLDTYLQQIFEDGFFHADPHPGNLFVEQQPVSIRFVASVNPGSRNTVDSRDSGLVTWQLTFVDFGMVGRVPPNLREGLRELIVAVGTRDSQRVIKAYQQMDILLPSADLKTLERANAMVFEKYWGKNMDELTKLSMRDFREFLDEFRDLVYDLPFQIPQYLIFLVRTINILSGMCIGLNPKFNVFNHIIPYAQKIMAQEAKINRTEWLNQLESVARSWISTPMKIDILLRKLETGDVSMRNPDVNQQMIRVEKAVHTLGFGIVFSALLLAGVQFILGGYPTWGYIFLAIAGLIIFILLWRKMISS